jgi:hypothetical protein
MTTKSPTKNTTQQALELYRTADRPGNSRTFLAALLRKTRKYERAAIARNDRQAADFHRGVAETVEIVINDQSGGDQ